MIPKTIILLSGGLDSTVLLYDLKSKGHTDSTLRALLFDYEQKHFKELHWALHHSSACGIRPELVSLPPLGGLTDESWVVPFRNAVFLSHAVSYAVRYGYKTVCIAVNADDADMFPDCRPEFIVAMNDATSAAGYNVEIHAPYIDKSKAWIGERAWQLGVKPDEIWTCYLGGEQPCGQCLACKKLEAACGK